MLTGKQKRFLRALGSKLDPILQVGKFGVTAPVIAQAEEALEARELFKGRALETSPADAETSAEQLAAATGAEMVQVIGRNFLLYRRKKDKPIMELPI